VTAARVHTGNGLKALEPPHVLIVEDMDMCAMVLECLLANLGCSSDIAEDGQEALDKLNAAEPGLYSLILMDLRMPVMDGFQATDVIKNTLKLPIPVVALTADDTQVRVAESAEIAPRPTKGRGVAAPLGGFLLVDWSVLDCALAAVLSPLLLWLAVSLPPVSRSVAWLTRQDARDKCDKIGFDDFASKPLSKQGLEALLEKHAGHKVAADS
jgi:CheY-like chemotaxis protein